jgi:glycosyltransferase involved in cell wall biosynthesis
VVNRKKKIAFIMHGGVGGGLYSQGFPPIVYLIEEFAKSYDVTIFSLSSFNKDFHPENYKAFAVPKWVRFHILKWLCLAIIFLLKRIRNKYAVLYSFWGHPSGTVTVLLGKLFSNPSVVTLLGAETANIPELNYGLFRNPSGKKKILWTCEKATTLITVSGCQADKLIEIGLKRDIKIIPMGVKKENFYPIAKEMELPLKILHVANLNEIKDQETLIRAFEIIRGKIPSVLKIVGPDFLNGQLQRLTRELGLSNDIEFVGPVAHRLLLPYFQWADAFMLTSLSEGQNMAITEAMMCGLLPISTKVGIMHDIGSEVGIVADIGDYHGLATQTISLYNQPNEWERKRKAAFAWATQHDFDWTTQQIKNILNNE